MRPLEAEAYLETMLERAGLDPDHLDLWEAWKVFKEFVKAPVAADGEGVCFFAWQDEGEEGRRVHLQILRQFTAIEGEESVPIRNAGLGLIYDPAGFDLTEEVEFWSYDFPTFADFAAHVERSPFFQSAAARVAVETGLVGGEL